MLDLSFITNAAQAAGATDRSPHGIGAAAPAAGLSFLDALAAMASLTATQGDEHVSAAAAEAAGETTVDDTADASPDAATAGDASAAFLAAIENLPVTPAATDEPAAAAAADSSSVDADTAIAGPTSGEIPASSVASIERTGFVAPVSTFTVPASGPVSTSTPAADRPSSSPASATTTDAPARIVPTSIPGEVAPSAGAAIEAAAAEGQPAAPTETAMAGERDARSSGARLAPAAARESSPVLDQLRAAGKAVERAESAHLSAVPAAVAGTGAIDAPASASHPPVAAAGVAAFTHGITAPSAGRSSGEGGDQTSGFGFAGYAAPRLAAPVPGGAPGAPTFASLVNAMHTPETVPAETTTQIVQAIRMQMMRDGGEAHIRLDPRQFGDMTVRIKVEQGQVTARVEADAPVVREWLQSNQHVLRQSLAGQQLTLDRLDVHEPPASSPQGRRDDASAREDARGEQRQPRRRRPDTGELFEVVA